MTFYNVISGILFLGACEAFLSALGKPSLAMAGTLVVVIFNEAVLTSELIERAVNPVDYTLKLKLLDLLTFITLAWALLVLTPVQNTFGVDVSQTLWGADRPFAFWALLTVYWFLTITWNYLSKQFEGRKWKGWFLWWAKLMFLPFLVSSIYYWGAESIGSVPRWAGCIPLFIMGSYLLSKLKARP
jgi:hypothetical protein